MRDEAAMDACMGIVLRGISEQPQKQGYYPRILCLQDQDLLVYLYKFMIGIMIMQTITIRLQEYFFIP